MKSRISELFAIDKFKLAYWIIAIATGQHTAWGAARIMQGEQPANDGWWWLQGIAFAIAIDYTMIMVAAKIRDGNRSNPKRYIATFAIVALLSFNFQLLYAWAHAEPLQQGGGVALSWVERLQTWIDSQIVVVPAALPIVALLYTIAGLGRGGEKESKSSKRASNGIPSEIRVEVPALPAKSNLGHSKAPDATRKVREHYEANPGDLEVNPKEIAKKLEVGKSTVYSVRKEMLERTSSNGHYEGDEL